MDLICMDLRDEEGRLTGAGKKKVFEHTKGHEGKGLSSGFEESSWSRWVNRKDTFIVRVLQY